MQCETLGYSDMSYRYQIKVKMRLIRVKTLFHFTYQNTLINFMVLLFIRYKLKWAISFKVPASLVFAAISESWFSGFSRFAMYKLTTAVTAFLIAFLIKSNNKKLDQIIFHVSNNLIIFHVQSYIVSHMWNILEHP